MTDKPLPPFSDFDTSLSAALSVEDITSHLRRMVYEYISRNSAYGIHGATCDEVERDLDLTHQTASPRVWELRNQGHIVDSGYRRPTRSGRKAVVWRTRR